MSAMHVIAVLYLPFGVWRLLDAIEQRRWGYAVWIATAVVGWLLILSR